MGLDHLKLRPTGCPGPGNCWGNLIILLASKVAVSPSNPFCILYSGGGEVVVFCDVAKPCLKVTFHLYSVAKVYTEFRRRCLSGSLFSAAVGY